MRAAEQSGGWRAASLAVAGLGLVFGAACGTQPCGDVDEDPQVRLDLAYGTCNFTPEAQISAPPQALRQSTVELDGTQSVDLNFEPLSYRWRLLSVPEGSVASIATPNMARARFSTDLAGDYVVELVVSDGDLEDRAEATVVVRNRAPVADAGPDQAAARGVSFVLDGTGSVDPDQDPLTFSWVLVSRPSGSNAALVDASTPRPYLVSDVEGSFTVRLVVSDGERDSEPDEVRLFVGASATPPIADAGPVRTASVGETVTLDGSGSFDLEMDPLTYQWTLVSTPTTSSAAISNPMSVQASLTPDVGGNYRVRLTVDDGTASSSDETEVVVSP